MSEQHNANGEDLIDPEDVLRIYGIPIGTQATWRSQRRYGFDRFVVKLGASVRYRRRDLDAWVAAGGAKALASKVEAPVAEALQALRTHDVQARELEAAAVPKRDTLARAKAAIAAADAIDREIEARVTTHQSRCVDFFRGVVSRADVDRSGAELALAKEAAEVIRRKATEARGALETLQSDVDAANARCNELNNRRDDFVYHLRRAIAVQLMHEAHDQFDSAYESYCVAHVAANAAGELAYRWDRPTENPPHRPAVASLAVPSSFIIGTTVCNFKDPRWPEDGIVRYFPTAAALAAAKEALGKRVAEILRSPIAESTNSSHASAQLLTDEFELSSSDHA